MKLEDIYVDHMHGTVSMYLGSRNQALIPHTVNARGALASPDRELLTVYVLENHQSEKLLQNLNDNGKFSLTAANFATFETFQLKGTFVSSRPSDSQDAAVQAIYNNKLIGVFSYMYPHLIERFKLRIQAPMISLTLRVDEVFEQTPGPGTGNKIS